MTAYDRGELARLITQVESTGRHGTNHAKGSAMADLVAHLFQQIPGVELRHREFLALDQTSEIDLVFRNQPQVSQLFDGVTLHMALVLYGVTALGWPLRSATIMGLACAQ